jgi:hypothetical protein
VETSEVAWLVLGYCGDYYCEDEHPIAVATTPQAAHELAQAASDAVFESAHPYKMWPKVWVRPVAPDELIPRDALR